MKIHQDEAQYLRMLKRCLVLFGVLVFTISFGVIGYRQIEGWSFSDALYMTIITVGTVGYKEVGDLSETGRIFTEVLIFIGMIGIGGWVAVVTSLFLDTDLREYFRRKKMIDKISKMRGHTIICGGGSTGVAIIQDLYDKGFDIVVIENDPEAVKQIEYKFPKVAVVEGTATSEEALWIANVKAARNLVASLASDVDNLYIVITARDLNENLFIVARIFDDSTAQRVQKAGANEVVSPNKIGGQRMAQLCYARN